MVVTGPDTVQGFIAGKIAIHDMAGTPVAVLGPTHEDVVNPAIGFQSGGNMGIGVVPSHPGPAATGHAPCIVKAQTFDGTGCEPFNHAYFLRLGVGIEIAAHDGRKIPGPLTIDEAREVRHLTLTNVAVFEFPI